MHVTKFLSVLSTAFLFFNDGYSLATQKRGIEAIPANFTLTSNPQLPDPFTNIDGTKVTTLAGWQSRREELSSLIQTYELGTLPGPPTTLKASFASNTLTITAGVGSLSITWTVGITLPKVGTGPFPAIIIFEGTTIPIPSTVAQISFTVSNFAQQNDLSSRGVGTFFNLFPSEHNASALIAWSWGVSRIIDALELTPAANINPAKIAVTGCSRDGKGALVAGAFEPRIALTIPEESGSGGSACWRLSDWQLAAGQLVQTASEIVQENVWESVSFQQFATNTDLLPFDHHSLAGLIAPRGLLIIDNPDFIWLGPESCFGCMQAGQLIYQALGVKNNLGYSSVGGHSHCAFPASQTQTVTNFFNQFLLDIPTNTAVFSSTEAFANFSLSTWANWPVPTLV